MDIAIGFYEQGDDLEAMDRFMEILVNGNPGERPMANEYLNLISQRMAIGGAVERRAVPGATVIENVSNASPASPARGPIPEPENGLPPSPAERRSAPREPSLVPESSEPEGPEPAEAPRRSQELSKGDREVMKREIESKIGSRSRVLLNQLRRYEDLRIEMANRRLPRAIGIPADLIFGEGTRFKTEAAPILNALGHLVFSLGATQVIILPERALMGDSKIMDMRRTMGISAHLLKSGIAPSRVQVNLLTNQVDIPPEFRDFLGVLILFVYNQPLMLNTESTVGTEAGPPISLGVSPESIDSAQGEGAILEFSVMEPPSGLMSWRFQLLGPGAQPGDDLVPLQEVKGSGPVFHQIYWNGREKYFGRTLTPGRYEAVLTATDMQNRSRKKHVWISVEGPEPQPRQEETRAAESAKDSKPQAPPPAELPGSETPAPKQGTTITRRPRPRAGKRKSRAAAKSPAEIASKTIPAEDGSAAAPEAAPEEAEKDPRATRAGAVNYQVVFVKNTANITTDGENILGRVADTMHYYPLDNINLVGYASTGESTPESLASERADLVMKLLVDKHGMKGDRIKVQTKVVDRDASKVEIYIVAGGQ